MNRMPTNNKKKYTSPQVKVYRSLKDITAANTVCVCTDVNCPVYCQQYAYPMGGYGAVYSTWCPRDQ